jgi:hypothetical protein
MLSIAQFKHANLSSYSHAPSYMVGNSYATTQVSRYKTWARVRALKSVPGDSMDPYTLHDKFLLGPEDCDNLIPHTIELFPWDSNWNFSNAPIRDENGVYEHQNTTIDHSFYTNRILFDGYFFTGISDDDFDSSNDFTLFPQDIEPGIRYTPFRNPRLIPFFRDNWQTEDGHWNLCDYNEKISDEDTKNDLEPEIEMFRYQTMAADLLVDGAFNINSTSVDAWVAHLAALKEVSIPGTDIPSGETPFPRFFNKIPQNKNWNKICTLDDQQIKKLALCIVKQVKLRGPFLSYADFVNRRIVQPEPVRANGGEEVPLNHPSYKWSSETRQSVTGLRGAIQSAIADAGINQSDFSFELSEQPFGNPVIPDFPSKRFNTGSVNAYHFNEDYFQSAGFNFSEFGLHAVSSSSSSDVYSYPAHPISAGNNNKVTYKQRYGRGIEEIESRIDFSSEWFASYLGSTSYEYDFENYADTFFYGEAPDNLLAIENLATAANKPGWLMQADVLTPLAPVSSARSDTFVIRVMGEAPQVDDQVFTSRSWIELTVQRIPDYVKSHLDAPHHRPHEPFGDIDFNGYHNNEEPWLDLNQNGTSFSKDSPVPVPETKNAGRGPDLPGVGDRAASGDYKDGLKSDLALNGDESEEDVNENSDFISKRGINQRFGRKFKIIKFRWLNENDV